MRDGAQLLGRTGMARESQAADAYSGGSKTLAQIAHLVGGAGQPMYQENAKSRAREEKLASIHVWWVRLVVRLGHSLTADACGLAPALSIRSAADFVAVNLDLRPTLECAHKVQTA